MMRNINRIDPIMNELTEYWKANQDLRFFQMIGNLLQQSYCDCGGDTFYKEDDVALEFLQEQIKKYENYRKSRYAQIPNIKTCNTCGHYVDGCMCKYTVNPKNGVVICKTTCEDYTMGRCKSNGMAEIKLPRDCMWGR